MPAFISSLKVAVTTERGSTLVAPAPGVCATSTGAAVLGLLLYVTVTESSSGVCNGLLVDSTASYCRYRAAPPIAPRFTILAAVCAAEVSP